MNLNKPYGRTPLKTGGLPNCVINSGMDGAKTLELRRKHGISSPTFYIYGRLSCRKDFFEPF